MKKLALVLVVAILSACGSEDPATILGSGGGASAAGSSGSAGAAGSAGSGGSAGSAGAAGSSGSAGAAGLPGDAGVDAASDATTDAASDATTDAASDANACPDPLNEPNEAESTAATVDDVNDCDAKKTVGGIAAPGDVDWYTFKGTDNLLSCTPNPKATVSAGLRVCIFAKCTSGTTTLTCAQGATETSPGGVHGCCATGGTAETTPSCSGLGADDAQLFVRVDQPGGAACTAYQLEYSY